MEGGFDKLIYMSIRAYSVGRQNDPYQVREPIYLKWEEYLKDWAENKAPEGLKDPF